MILDPEPNAPLTWSHSVLVPGLIIGEAFISPSQEASLMEQIDLAEWKSNGRGDRRIQHYGVHYDEEVRMYRVWEDSAVTPLPPFMQELMDQIKQHAIELFPEHYYLYGALGLSKRTAVFINEYLENDELAFHFDHPVTYEEVIVGVSLGAASWFRFKKEDAEHPVLLKRRSIYFMSGSSRFEWQHGLIPGDVQGRRVSLTFRVVCEKAVLKR